MERLLRQTVGQYNPEIQQTEIKNPSTDDGQKMTYTVTLKEVDERVCQQMIGKGDVLSSVNITIIFFLTKNHLMIKYIYYLYRRSF